MTLAALNIATAMTNVIRQQGSAASYITGAAHTKVSFLNVRWAWVAYPLGLDFLVLSFLVATMVLTSRSGVQNVWKSSPIAMLFHGLENRGRALENVSEIKKMCEMTELAGRLKVRLSRKGGSTTLVDAKGDHEDENED